MTDAELASAANDGSKSAMQTLLQRHRREIRSIVWHEVTKQRATFSVLEDAFAEAMLSFWRGVAHWDPALGTLIAFSRLNILRAVWRIVAYYGHAVTLPHRSAKKLAIAVNARACAVKRTRSLEAPISHDNEDTLRDVLGAPCVPVDEALDAARVLAALDPRDREVLARTAEGESLTEIGRDRGHTRAGVAGAYHRALARARQHVRPGRVA